MYDDDDVLCEDICLILGIHLRHIPGTIGMTCVLNGCMTDCVTVQMCAITGFIYIIYVKSMTKIVFLLDSTTTGCSFKLKQRMVWTVLALTCTSWPKDGDSRDIDPDQDAIWKPRKIPTTNVQWDWGSGRPAGRPCIAQCTYYTHTHTHDL
jgi:hypothetical protein